MTRQRFLHPTDRRKAQKRRYGTGKWATRRRLVLERDGRQCQLRVSKKCLGEANTVDHIIRPEEWTGLGDPDALDNLRAVCRPCNLTRHGAQYFREHYDALLRGESVPSPAPVPTAAFPRPESRVGRPAAGATDRFIAWAMSLHGVGGEPTDHGHGRWDIAPMVCHRSGAYRVCPATCASPVRWPDRRAA